MTKKSDEAQSYPENLSDYELMKRLHELRPDKYPDPDTDPDIQQALKDAADD